MPDYVDDLVTWTLRMSRAEREAEAIHVTRTSVGLGALGFIALAVGNPCCAGRRPAEDSNSFFWLWAPCVLPPRCSTTLISIG